MASPNQATELIVILIAIASGALVFQFVYAPLVVDILRQYLFGQRRELFLLAVDEPEALGVDHPAHQRLRAYINQSLLHLEDASFFRMAFWTIVVLRDRQLASSALFDAMETVKNKEVHARVRHISNVVTVLIVARIFFTAPIFAVPTFFYALWRSATYDLRHRRADGPRVGSRFAEGQLVLLRSAELGLSPAPMRAA